MMKLDSGLDCCFQIDIEVRHVPQNRTASRAWFAIDDILIENCPFGKQSLASPSDR